MTAAEFLQWLAAMKTAGIAKSDAACARLLGVSKTSVVNLKRNGGDRRLKLACAALLHQIEIS